MITSLQVVCAPPLSISQVLEESFIEKQETAKSCSSCA